MLFKVIISIYLLNLNIFLSFTLNTELFSEFLATFFEFIRILTEIHHDFRFSVFIQVHFLKFLQILNIFLTYSIIFRIPCYLFWIYSNSDWNTPRFPLLCIYSGPLFEISANFDYFSVNVFEFRQIPYPIHMYWIFKKTTISFFQINYIIAIIY